MKKRINRKSSDPVPAAERGGAEQQSELNGISTGRIDVLQRKCSACAEEEKETIDRKPLTSFIQRKESAGTGTVTDAMSSEINSTRGSGKEMDANTKGVMESRFGTDFSNVKIHTGESAVQMNRALNAQAFTVGNDIYFNEGEYQANTHHGKQLLAHELAHTLQQGNMIRRMPKDRFGRPLGFFPTPQQEEYDRQSLAIGLEMQAEILREPVYQNLKQESKDRVRRILDKALGRPPGFAKGQRYYYLQKLKLAITTPFDGVDTGNEDYGCSPENDRVNREKVDKALVEEKRYWDGLFADVDEKFVASGTNTTTRVGRKNKKFTVDRTDVNNIRVKIKVKLIGVAADVEKIKKLEDAIERAVSISTKGYHLDIVFVDNTGDDVFEFTVKFCVWPNAANWASPPDTLSHEVHHALGLGDRYDYIESHAGNRKMNVASRLQWFEEEMNKTAPNNPHSKMATNTNPLLNDDVCAVAFDPGAERDKCIAERTKFNPAGTQP